MPQDINAVIMFFEEKSRKNLIILYTPVIANDVNWQNACTSTQLARQNMQYAF